MKTLIPFVLAVFFAISTMGCHTSEAPSEPPTTPTWSKVYRGTWLDGVYCLCFPQAERCYYFVMPAQGGPTQVMGDDGKPLRCSLEYTRGWGG